MSNIQKPKLAQILLHMQAHSLNFPLKERSERNGSNTNNYVCSQLSFQKEIEPDPSAVWIEMSQILYANSKALQRSRDSANMEASV